MLDFTKLWNKAYIFGPNPIDLSRSDHIFFWLALGLVVAGIVAKLLVFRQDRDSPRRFLLNRLFHLFVTMGFFVLLWAGFRFENIPWLSTHFLVLLLFLISLVWFGFIFKYFVWGYRHQQKIWHDETVKRKYLPR